MKMSTTMRLCGALALTFLLALMAGAQVPPTPPAPNPAAVPAPLNVLVIGDSNTENGHVTGGLAKAFEQSYGYFGSGYHSLVENVGNGRADCYRPYLQITNEGEWTKRYMVPQDHREGYLSPDGTCIQSATPGATTRVAFYGTAVDLYWLADPKGGTFTLTVDDAPAQEIGTTADKLVVSRTRITDLAAGWHTLVATVKTGTVILLGVETHVAAKGDLVAVVHKWGRSYAESQHFAKINEELQKQALQYLHPDWVVIFLGTNDHNLGGNSYLVYESYMTTLVRRIQAAVPKARILIGSTLPSGGGASDLLRQSYLRLLPTLTETLGVHYWNLADWTGGTVASMLEKGYVDKQDAIHFNAAGGEAVGQALHQQLLAATPQTVKPETLSQVGAGDPDRPKLPGYIRLWLAADAMVSVDPARRVAAWGNLVKQPGAEQMVPSLRPTLVDNALNGKPVLRFDGVSTYLLALNCSVKGVVVVCRAQRTGGALFSEGRTFYQPFGPGPKGSAKLVDRSIAKWKGTSYVNGVETPLEELAYPLEGYQILTFAPSDGLGISVIGANQYHSRYQKIDEEFLAYWDGDIAEILVFTDTFDEKTRTSAEAYLGKKYGILLGVPK